MKEVKIMNILFLDYDGVVNTPMWDVEGKRCSYGFPRDNKVNNFQACQWVSEFCEKYGYSIVVTSTWRFDENYAECLRNGGLRAQIEILGKTKNIGNRSDEIQKYLDEHPEIENFIIVDDDFIDEKFSKHYVWCDAIIGFTLSSFIKAEKLHQAFQHQKK